MNMEEEQSVIKADDICAYKDRQTMLYKIVRLIDKFL